MRPFMGRGAVCPKEMRGQLQLGAWYGNSPAGRWHVHDPNPSFSLDWKSGRNNQWLWTFLYRAPAGSGHFGVKGCAAKEGAWGPARVPIAQTIVVVVVQPSPPKNIQYHSQDNDRPCVAWTPATSRALVIVRRSHSSSSRQTCHAIRAPNPHPATL